MTNYGVEKSKSTGKRFSLAIQNWRRSPQQVKKLLGVDNKISSIVVDPLLKTADVDRGNNFYPRRIIPSRIESFKSERRGGLRNRDLIEDYQD